MENNYILGLDIGISSVGWALLALDDNDKIEKLIIEYKRKQFKDFDTWDKNDEELIEIYEECIKKNKSYDELYGKNKYSKFIDD